MLELTREFQATQRVRLPQIHAGTKPIPIIFADAKRCARKQRFRYGAIAAVEAQHKRARELVQLWLKDSTR